MAKTFEQIIGEIRRKNSDVGDLVQYLCVKTRGMRDFVEEPSGFASITYKLQAPGSRGPIAIVRYTFFPSGKGERMTHAECSLRPANVGRTVPFDERKFLEDLETRLDRWSVAPRERKHPEDRQIYAYVRTPAEANTWLELLEGALSGAY